MNNDFSVPWLWWHYLSLSSYFLLIHDQSGEKRSHFKQKTNTPVCTIVPFSFVIATHLPFFLSFFKDSQSRCGRLYYLGFFVLKRNGSLILS